MTFAEIEAALQARLLIVAGVSGIAWDNKVASLALPYLEASNAFTLRRNGTVDKSINPDQEGLLSVNVVVEADTFNTQALTIAQAVVDAFFEGARFCGLIVTQAEARGGFRGPSGDWNIPVSIRYQTE